MKHMLKKWANESGAIMLEVVAVLSLMGLMGTMLFRQIYLRNQELHNIQMASEIRLVKEGFSAWIQARHSTLATVCGTPNIDQVVSCKLVKADDLDEIVDFLPEGYFAAGDEYTRDAEIRDNYDFFLTSYWRGLPGEEILTFYGVVIPKRAALPDGGEDPSTWNFRRAARVAMLIGIDGGAFGPGVTVDESSSPIIAGAVGTWSLPTGDFDGSGPSGDAADVGFSEIPTYVAITGIDVYQPELNIPDVQLGLKDDWDLALRDATAYGKFTVGAQTGCYTKADPRHATLVGDIWVLESDDINDPSASCTPAFYVSTEDDAGTERGEVYVLNDLHVGHDYDTGKSAIRFDKDGMIMFESELGADPANPSNLGDKRIYDPQTGKDIHYMLDPRYTSVMNDIKVMSRGGAKLSDILPNYILKEVKRRENDPNGSAACLEITVPAKYCPSGYKLAIVAQPVRWGDDKEVTKATLNKEGAKVKVKATDLDNYVDVEINSSNTDFVTGLTPVTSGGDVVTDVKTRRAIYIGGSAPSTLSRDVSDHNLSVPSSLKLDNPTSNTVYYACFGSLDGSDNFTVDRDAEGLVYLYCVFPQDFDWDGAGTGSKPHSEECGRFKDQGDCEGHDCTWTPGVSPNPGTCG